MDWKKNLTPSRKDAKKTREASGQTLVGLRSKTSLVESTQHVGYQEDHQYGAKPDACAPTGAPTAATVVASAAS
jgi:hypothetical protein